MNPASSAQSPLDHSVNAWIMLNCNSPAGSSYNTPGNCFQTLITAGVYNSTDMVSLTWCGTVPTSSTTVPSGKGDSYTLQLGQATHPDGTNQDYMDWVIRDARKVNPNIKILIMLGWGDTQISRIFGSDSTQWKAQAAAFAQNLIAYLDHYQLDGFDVDWESGIVNTPQQQFAIFFTAIGEAFRKKQGTKKYFLTLSPANVGNIDPGTINNYFDFVNLQLYSGFTFASDFINAGVNASRLAYGAKFEAGFQNAASACQGYLAGPGGGSSSPYKAATQWRLTSGNYLYEQAQQMILFQLIHGIAGPGFDDTPIVRLAGNPLIQQLTIRSGDVLDALQATNGASFEGQAYPPYVLPQHGGNGGGATVVSILSSDPLASVSGFTGSWYGWNCVLQITLKTRSGKTLGTFGSMAGAANPTPFSYAAPAGQSIVAFSGTTATVPMAGGGSSAIVTSLNVSCA